MIYDLNVFFMIFCKFDNLRTSGLDSESVVTFQYFNFMKPNNVLAKAKKSFEKLL